jgi:hypothetical protein
MSLSSNCLGIDGVLELSLGLELLLSDEAVPSIKFILLFLSLAQSPVTSRVEF